MNVFSLPKRMHDNRSAGGTQPYIAMEILLNPLIYVVLGCVCLFPANASSHTFILPPRAPLLSVTIPDSLEPTDTLSGAEGGVSEERTFNVDIEPLGVVDLKAAIDESVRMLDQHGIELDAASIGQNAKRINELDAVDLSFATVDGTQKAAITLVAAKPGGAFFALIAWGSERGFTDNAEAMKSIVESIRAAK
jgi:hypothetical protein